MAFYNTTDGQFGGVPYAEDEGTHEPISASGALGEDVEHVMADVVAQDGSQNDRADCSASGALAQLVTELLRQSPRPLKRRAIDTISGSNRLEYTHEILHNLLILVVNEACPTNIELEELVLSLHIREKLSLNHKT